jgi:hypothetical protein
MVTEAKRVSEVRRAPDGTLEGLALWGFLGLTLAASLGWVLWLLE